jgi:putative ABC transport system substrate-binding protein
MVIHIRRREFIVALGGAATRPLAARAQQSRGLRRVGVLMTFAADDPDGQANSAALAQGLQEFGWTVGRNLLLDYRWGANDLDRFRRYAAELIVLSPDVVVATAGSVVTAFQQASRTVPIVFVTTIDPVGGGWVESLARPGGNATGFSSYEFSISAKWLEMLKRRDGALDLAGVAHVDRVHLQLYQPIPTRGRLCRSHPQG